MSSRLKGVSGTFEFALRFTKWVQLLGREPTVQDVQKAFSLGQRQAYRYLQYWRNANGVYE